MAEHRVESCNIAVSTDDVAVSTATYTASCRTLTDSITRLCGFAEHTSLPQNSQLQDQSRIRRAIAQVGCVMVGEGVTPMRVNLRDVQARHLRY